MKRERIVYIFDLVKGIEAQVVSVSVYLYALVEAVEKIKEEWLSKLPYHLNVIDE